MSGRYEYKLVYRLGGGVDIYRKEEFYSVYSYDVRKNGHLMGSYKSLEDAQASISY